MGSAEVMLTWNGHHRTLIGVFEKLLECNALVDCTITAAGRQLKAHKEVLAAFSPFFETLFKDDVEKNPTVILSGFNFQDLKYIIDFIYHGKVTVHEDQVEELIDAAQSLQIKGLGGGQKESASNIENEYGQSRETYSTFLTRKRRRNIDDDDDDDDEYGSDSYGEWSVSIETAVKSSRHRKAGDMISSDNQSTSSSKSHCSNINSKEPFEPSPSVSGNYPSFPVQPSLLSPDTEDQVLDPASLLAIELDTDKKAVQSKKDNVIPGIKMESEGVDSCNRSRSNYGRMGENHHSPPDVNAQVGNTYSETLSASAQNELSAPDMVVKKEPTLGDDDIVCESETFNEMSSVYEDMGRGHRVNINLGSEGNLGTSMGPISSQVQQPYRSTEASSRRMVHIPHDWRQGPNISSIGSVSIEPIPRRMPGRRAPREYTCPECHKIFRQSCNLKVHMRTHTGERPYKCTECDFAATHISNLKQHQRIHSGERPYKCSICNFAAAGSGDLKKHQRIHSGEKPYRCPNCDFAAAGSGDLQKHMRIHGKMDRPLNDSDFDCSVPGTSDLIHSIPKYFENNYLLKMSNF